ncbi:high-affinity choline transporter 1-like [Amblyomma americanum]
MGNVSGPMGAILMACFVLTYTTLGGCYSVVYTDTVHFITCSIGMWICLPFCMSHTHVGTLKGPEASLAGAISTEDAISVIDIVCATALGGLARQEFFQSVLCSDRVVTAKITSYLSGIGCLLAALPPIIVGSAAKLTTRNSRQCFMCAEKKPENTCLAAFGSARQPNTDRFVRCGKPAL